MDLARTAASRGTKVHHMCEDYLNNVHTNYPSKWEKTQKGFPTIEFVWTVKG